MEQELNLPYDRALSEAVWRRVAPELTPFAPLPAPEEREACCMAAPTEDGLVRVQRFIDEEVSMARAYRCRARRAPPAARRTLLRMADEELSHARTLLTAHYLMTGRFYQPPAAAGQEPSMPWCQLLRELYHEEACGGAAYAQAAEDTEDVCLRELFQRLSRAEYGHAAMLLRLLENSLTSGNNLLK